VRDSARRVPRLVAKNRWAAQVISCRLLQVRRSEQVAPAQRDKALQKLATSIKLREDQAKKSGGGNKGHDHMLDVLKVCPRQRSFAKNSQVLHQDGN
jgi:hypothetical protein